MQQKVTDKQDKDKEDYATLKYQQLLKEKGAAGNESGPSGSNLDDDEFMREFAAGNRSSQEDFKRAAEIQTKY